MMSLLGCVKFCDVLPHFVPQRLFHARTFAQCVRCSVLALSRRCRTGSEKVRVNPLNLNRHGAGQLHTNECFLTMTPLGTIDVIAENFCSYYVISNWGEVTRHPLAHVYFNCLREFKALRLYLDSHGVPPRC